VQLTVTTYDGRSASTSPTVQVRTHDVAIAKFAVPGAAKAGQTRTIVVGLSSKRYFEEVEVQLFKRVPGGNTWHPTLGPRREAGYPAYAELPTRILVELAGLQAEMRAALGSVRVPVLLIHSRQDAAAPPDSMPQIYQALGTEDKEMLWLEGFDHAVVRDPKRAEAFEAIAAFLERVTGSG
jgi:pimeloyl-ACP methyl ester carboxylesterase